MWEELYLLEVRSSSSVAGEAGSGALAEAIEADIG